MEMRKTKISPIKNNKGIALVMALIITLVVFLLIGSTLYVITQSTRISGAGKRYATAAEAADGAVEVMKDAINLVMYGEPASSLPMSNTSGLVDALATDNTPATVNLNLPSTSFFNSYQAKITVERLYTKALPGGRIEFARSAGGAGSTAVYFRISTVVTGPNNTKAETTALYRFVG
jgi:Tfp pilus assembly protein PilX